MASATSAANEASGALHALSTAREAQIANLSEGDALPPVHPGEILAEEFLAPLGLGSTRAAKALGVPRTRIERLIAGETAMTEDTALRLERWTGASAEFWLGLQTDYNLRMARAHLDPAIASIEPVTLERVG